jgi:hypothetical protein
MTNVEARDARLDELIGRVATALRARVEAQRRAEERLASFAFTESAPVSGQAAGDEPDGADWLYFLLRALRLLGESDTVRLLRHLRDGGRSLADLPVLAGSGLGDRLAAADWIGGLASAGFVVRELERDRVVLAPLGAAMLDLLTEIEQRVGEDGQA